MDGGVAVRSRAIAQRFVGHVMTAAPSAVMPWAVSGSPTGNTRAILRVSSNSWE